MNRLSLRRATGLLLIAGAVLVNLPYAWLVVNFEYPDVLRLPAGEILTRFQAGGTTIILVWLAFAWAGLPLLPAMIWLRRALGEEQTPLWEAATVAGVIAFLVQAAGLLRWVFVVPVLARLYTDSAAGAVTKEAAAVSFQVIHQYGGVILGEHIGQLFTIIWTVLVCLGLYATSRKIAWLGLLASAVYLLAQTELLATAIPTAPVVPAAGLIGSLLWLLWLLVLGVKLVRPEAAAEAIRRAAPAL